MFRVCHAFLSVHCSIAVTCWDRVNLLALLYVMFSYVFVTFPYGFLGQVWYLIVSTFDLCLLTCFGLTCWEMVNLLALLFVMFSCVFVTFLCSVLVQVWCLILSINYLCLLTYFVKCKKAPIFLACLTVCSKGKMNFVLFKLFVMLCNPYVSEVLGFVYQRCIGRRSSYSLSYVCTSIRPESNEALVGGYVFLILIRS